MATDRIEPAASEEREEARPSIAPGAHPRRRRSDQVQSSAQIVIAIAVVLTICYVAKLVLVVLLVSILIAFILEPLVGLMEEIRIPRGLGALIAVLLLMGAIYGATYVSYSKAQDFMQDLPKYSAKIREALGKFREKARSIQKTTEGVLPEESKEEKEKTVRVQQTSSWGDWLTNSLGTVGEIVLAVSFIPFLVYFMLTWENHTRAATVMLFSMENRNTAYVTLGRISAMIRSFILGNLIVGLFLSVATVVVFAFLHLPYFYFLGIISGFLSLVPYLGVVLAMAPPLLAGFGVLDAGGVVIILITVLSLHLFAINVLYPKLIGRRLQLNPLAVTIALLLWGWLWGAMGLILAVPITAALKIIFDHVEKLRAYGTWLGE